MSTFPDFPVRAKQTGPSSAAQACDRKTDTTISKDAQIFRPNVRDSKWAAQLSDDQLQVVYH